MQFSCFESRLSRNYALEIPNAITEIPTVFVIEDELSDILGSKDVLKFGS